MQSILYTQSVRGSVMNTDIGIFSCLTGLTLVIMELILKFYILFLLSNAMYHHFSGKGTAFSISPVTSGGGRVTEHWSAVTLILMECGGSGLAADSHNALFCSSSIPILIIIDCWSCNLLLLNSSSILPIRIEPH